jgi:hypothetical protein
LWKSRNQGPTQQPYKKKIAEEARQKTPLEEEKHKYGYIPNILNI